MKKLFLVFLLIGLIINVQSQEKKVWFPQVIKERGLRLTMGYNDPGEAENDGRDVRLWTDSYKLVAGELGRIVLKCEDDELSYATPSNVPVYETVKDGRTFWSWYIVDNRSGVCQRNTMIYDGTNITVVIYIKLLYGAKGSLSVPFLTASQDWKCFDIKGNSLENTDNAAGFIVNIDNRDFAWTFINLKEETSLLRNNYQNYYHLVRRVVDMGDVYIERDFPKGYENAFVININTEGKPYYVKTNINYLYSSNIQFGDKDKEGNYYIPKVCNPLSFLPEEKQECGVSVMNLTDKPRDIKVNWTITDYNNKTVLENSKTLNLSPLSPEFLNIEFNLPYGIYSLNVVSEDNEIVRRFMVLRDPVKIDKEDSFFGIQAVFSSYEDNYIDLLNRIGCHFIRVGTGGTWWPADREECFSTYDENNIGYFFCMTPNDLDVFNKKDFGGPYYEIFNEPDSWVPIKEYPEKVKEYSDKIKSINPSAKIIAGSVSNGDTDSGFPYIKNLYNSGVMFDILSIHPYSGARAIGPKLEPLSPDKNRMENKLAEAVNLAKEHGNDVWIGELGNTLLEEVRFPEKEFNKYEKQYANYLARIFLTAKMFPEIKKIIYFHICFEKLGLNIGPDAANNGPYNMLAQENNPEPILAAYATLSASIDGSKLVERLVFDDENIKGIVTERDEEYFIALWSGKNVYKMSLGRVLGVTLRNICGTDREYDFEDIEISQEPVYLITKDKSLIDKIKYSKMVLVSDETEIYDTDIDYDSLDITWHAKENSKPIIIDGDLSEWDDLPIILNRQECIIPPDPGFWKGPEDLSAKIGAKYDDKYLYLGLEVTDDMHRNSQEAASLWKEDSLQVSISNITNPFNNVELNVGIGKDKEPIIYPLVGGMSEIKGYVIGMKREGSKTVYEFALPFDQFEVAMGKGKYCRVGLIINDLDMTEQRKWAGVKDPVYIGATKEPNNMPVMAFE